MTTTVIIPKRRQERRGTAAAAALLNEILLAGEWFIETDTLKFKIGDGVTAYNSLLYVGELANLGDPAADRLVYWDNTINQYSFLKLGTGLAIGSGGDLDVTVTGGSQASIQFKDEGTNLGTSGTVDTVDFTGSVTASRAGNVVTVNVTGGSASDAVDTLSNLTIATSRSAGAETIALKTKAGTDPASGDAITLCFRDAASTTGGYTARTITAATSLVINSGATLGADKSATSTVTIATPAVARQGSSGPDYHRQRPGDSFVWSTTGALPTGITAGTTYYIIEAGFSQLTFQFSATLGGAAVNTSGTQSGVHTITWLPKPFRVWIVAGDDAGTIRLGVIKCSLPNFNVFSLRDDQIVSSTAIGTGSDSAGVFYSGSAWTSKAIRILGYLEYTLTVAGTWDAAPTFVQVFGKGMCMPGQIVQDRYTDLPLISQGTTLIPFDNTVPQSNEGDEYFSLAFSSRSLCNVLDFSGEFTFEVNTIGNNCAVILIKDTEPSAVAISIGSHAATASRARPFYLRHRQYVPSVSSITWHVRAGCNNASTLYLNSTNAGGANYGWATISALRAVEIMA
jgi:hypothetical protein